MTPEISLVVAAYEQPRSLRLALASLRRQTFCDFEVLIADDGSGDEVREVVAEAQRHLPQPVQHVRHADDGFRKTLIVNRAVAQASGRILVFIDGDCVLHRRFLERHHVRSARGSVLAGRRVLLDAHLSESVAEADVLAGRLEHISFWWGRGASAWLRRGPYLPWLHGFKNAGRSVYPILGSNFSLHREDFAAVNGFDERIVGRGLEDVNLDLRLCLAGFSRQCVAAEAIQYHLFHTSSPSGRSPELKRLLASPTSAWTPFGLQREPQ